jgi:hypothetical protein
MLTNPTHRLRCGGGAGAQWSGHEPRAGRCPRSPRAAAPGHAILRELQLGELRTLSVDEARLQYDQLVRAGQTQSHDRGPELEHRAIEERVALRRRLTGRR